MKERVGELTDKVSMESSGTDTEPAAATVAAQSPHRMVDRLDSLIA